MKFTSSFEDFLLNGDPFYLDHYHNEKISGVEIQANFVMQIIDWEAAEDGN